MRDDGELWGLVLAAGDGKRLAAVTKDASGRAVPKQYCALAGPTPLLDRSIGRVARLVSRRRIVTVVAEAHRPFWRERAAAQPAIPADNWISQPENRGTAAGLLLPLLEIARRDPGARLIVTPSDHQVANEFAFTRTLIDALSALERPLDRVLLVGITPDAPVGDYGWVVPVADDSAPQAPRSVARFVEKPGVDEAASLRAAGGVWNSFVLVARVRSLLALYERRAPGLLAALRTGTPATLAAIYESLPALDFSRDLLQGAEDRLALVVAPPCGWTDLGTPERLASVMPAPAETAPCLERRFEPQARRSRMRRRPALEPALAVG